MIGDVECDFAAFGTSDPVFLEAFCESGQSRSLNGDQARGAGDEAPIGRRSTGKLPARSVALGVLSTSKARPSRALGRTTRLADVGEPFLKSCRRSTVST